MELTGNLWFIGLRLIAIYKRWDGFVIPPLFCFATSTTFRAAGKVVLVCLRHGISVLGSSTRA